MIHDKSRVESIRARANEQLELLATLKARIGKGTLPQFDLVRNHLGDIESFFLAQLDRDRTPGEEATWLDAAEHMLQISSSEVAKMSEQLKHFGPGQAEIIGG